MIADRYFTTTLCYQTLAGFPLTKALHFAKDFQIEKPDYIFYLNVSPETANQRKNLELKAKNRNENSLEFNRKTHQQYQNLIVNKVWTTNWVNINGELNPSDIAIDIYGRIHSKL